MAQRVGQRFLSDPVDDELDLIRQRREVPIEVAANAQTALAADARAERDQRVDQPEIVERLGAQLAADPMDVVEAPQDGLRRSRSTPRPAATACSRRTLGAQGDGGQRLTNLVVQLARDPRPLALLRGKRPPAALAPLVLEPIEHRVERLGQRHYLASRAVDGSARRPG